MGCYSHASEYNKATMPCNQSHMYQSVDCTRPAGQDRVEMVVNRWPSATHALVAVAALGKQPSARSCVM